MNSNTSDIIRRYYRAYETKDRDTIESLVADSFSFTSPVDDHIDRAEYFNRCWPNSEQIRSFHIESLFEDGDKALALYELETVEGQRFKNTELFTVKDGKVTEVQVYFGSARDSSKD